MYVYVEKTVYVFYRHDKLSVDKLGLHETDRVHRVQIYRNKLEHTQY